LTRLAEAGLEPESGPEIPQGPLGAVARAVAIANTWIVYAGGVALLAASAILTYSVVVRNAFKIATDWQDEAAVFCIVGAVFTASAYVQSLRGHIGIELLAHFLSPRANRVRAILVDLGSFLFCAFFAWKSWTLLHEAYVDKQTTTSAWAPPLWIPYGLMAFGITLLALQIALQVAAAMQRRAR
jgi:TRAP-type C4-dicarboxylate transport system permease small subunit